MMSEIRGPPVIFIILIESINVSLHGTNKYLNKMVSWTYFTNDFQYTFIVMGKLCHFHYWNVFSYSGQFSWFGKKYIIISLCLRYSSSWYNIMTQSTIIIETKTYRCQHILWFNIQHQYYTDCSGSSDDCMIHTKFFSEVIMFWLSMESGS